LAEILMYMAASIALAAVLIASVRLALGPTAADRAVALDSMTVISISLIVFVALQAARTIYLDVALVYGILSFLGVVAVARYLEGGI
jgi:multicomponent Na+:H+ antiporter subunit F